MFQQKKQGNHQGLKCFNLCDSPCRSSLSLVTCNTGSVTCNTGNVKAKLTVTLNCEKSKDNNKPSMVQI